MAPMNVPRRLLGTAVYQDKIYAFGGSQEEPNWYISAVECYDPSSNTWKRLPDLPVTGECSAATIGPFIFIFVCGKGVYQFDPVKETYTRSIDLPVPDWFAFDVVAHGHKVYLFGGSEQGKWSDAFYSYDTIENKFEKLISMSTPRRRTAASFCKLD